MSNELVWKRVKQTQHPAVCEVCYKPVVKKNMAMIAVEEVNEFRGDDVTHVRHAKCHERKKEPRP